MFKGVDIFENNFNYGEPLTENTYYRRKIKNMTPVEKEEYDVKKRNYNKKNKEQIQENRDKNMDKILAYNRKYKSKKFVGLTTFYKNSKGEFCSVGAKEENNCA